MVGIGSAENFTLPQRHCPVLGIVLCFHVPDLPTSGRLHVISHSTLRAANRHSGPKVGLPPDPVPSNARSWMGILCQLQSLVDDAAKCSFEPKLPNAALHSNGDKREMTGRSVGVLYAY